MSITLALSAAAGADIFGHFGISGVDQAASLEMLVMQDEIIAYVESTMRNMEISDEKLGLHVVDAVGPGGSFLDTQHTVAHFRSEMWLPGLLDRRYHQAWFDEGQTTMAERCRSRMETLMRSYEPEPIDEELARALDGIAASARRNLES